MTSGYYFTAEPVGRCSCHTCVCEGCDYCREDEDAELEVPPPLDEPLTYDPADPWGTA